MPPPFYPDVVNFLAGNAFGRPVLPNVTFAGKTIAITGSNTGLGFDAAAHIVRLGVKKLILACRNRQKGEAAREEIYKSTGCRDSTTIEVWDVDLTKYDSVRAFVGRLNKDLDRLDGFIANAGVELINFDESEGIERTLTVNVISTFLMAVAVLPKLQATAEAYKVDTTLSIVGSCIHVVAPEDQLSPGNRDIFAALSDSKLADMKSRYKVSKLIGHQLFNALARRVDRLHANKAHRVNLNLVNPGWCKSGLSSNRPKAGFERVAALVLQRTQEKGSRTLVHAVSCGKEMNGKYLSECVVKQQSTYVNSEKGREDSERLWQAFIERLQTISPELVKTLPKGS